MPILKERAEEGHGLRRGLPCFLVRDELDADEQAAAPNRPDERPCRVFRRPGMLQELCRELTQEGTQVLSYTLRGGIEEEKEGRKEGRMNGERTEPGAEGRRGGER